MARRGWVDAARFLMAGLAFSTTLVHVPMLRRLVVFLVVCGNLREKCENSFHYCGISLTHLDTRGLSDSSLLVLLTSERTAHQTDHTSGETRPPQKYLLRSYM